jgi:hypothetical protein
MHALGVPVQAYAWAFPYLLGLILIVAVFSGTDGMQIGVLHHKVA